MANQKQNTRPHTLRALRNRNAVVHVTNHIDFIEVDGENSHGKYRESFELEDLRSANALANRIIRDEVIYG